MKVELSLLALEDRNGIFDYLEQYSPAAAVRIDEKIGETLQSRAVQRFRMTVSESRLLMPARPAR